jgi:hypothetical protein
VRDLIGDIHGHADEPEDLLRRLGDRETSAGIQPGTGSDSGRAPGGAGAAKESVPVPGSPRRAGIRESEKVCP